MAARRNSRARRAPRVRAATPSPTLTSAENWTRLRPCWMVGTNNGGSVERVDGFDPERAVTDTFLSTRMSEAVYVGLGGWSATPGALLPRGTSGEAIARLEKVQGADDRVRVANTSGVPWRCIAQLVIRYSDGRQGFGTGWFAGPRTVVTAAHCLEDPDTKARARRSR